MTVLVALRRHSMMGPALSARDRPQRRQRKGLIWHARAQPRRRGTPGRAAIRLGVLSAAGTN
jgi:hypothetical protein